MALNVSFISFNIQMCVTEPLIDPY